MQTHCCTFPHPQVCLLKVEPVGLDDLWACPFLTMKEILIGCMAICPNIWLKMGSWLKICSKMVSAVNPPARPAPNGKPPGNPPGKPPPGPPAD
eukprot:365535-Chlamydomonas_euryale.AAC.56